jgi:hypothetical protein
MRDGEQLAADNQIVADYNRRQIVRAAREKALTRLEAEIAARPSMNGVKYSIDEFRRTGRLPQGMVPLSPDDVTVNGIRIMGEYWAPEPVARVVNNHLSPGLRGNAIFDAYRGLGNTLNQAQLGLSAFHLGFTSMDATVSRAALGLEHLASGQAARGLGRDPLGAGGADHERDARGQDPRAYWIRRRPRRISSRSRTP